MIQGMGPGSIWGHSVQLRVTPVGMAIVRSLYSLPHLGFSHVCLLQERVFSALDALGSFAVHAA